MNYKTAIELRNVLVEDLKKNEKGLTAFLTKANEQWDNDPDWLVCIFEKNASLPVQTPKNVDRLDIRGRVQDAGNSLYESLSFCKPLQYLAGELMAQNEDYVLNHQGDNETIGAQHILEKRFTDNQITFLKELGTIIRTADYHEIANRKGYKPTNPIEKLEDNSICLRQIPLGFALLFLVITGLSAVSLVPSS